MRRAICILLFSLIPIITLTSCGAVAEPGPIVKSFEGTTDRLNDQEQVIFTIHYVNESDTESFSNVSLVMNYDEDLVDDEGFTQMSNLYPSSQEGTTMRWEIGSLSPGQSGSVLAPFEVDNSITPNLCELGGNLIIFGSHESGSDYRSPSRRIGIPIEGRPTCEETLDITRTAVANATGTRQFSDLFISIPQSDVPFLMSTPTIPFSPTPTIVPTVPTETPTIEPSATATSTLTPTSSPTHTPTSLPTSTFTITPSSTPTSTETPLPTPIPTHTPTSSPTATIVPSIEPTEDPSPELEDKSERKGMSDVIIGAIIGGIFVVVAAIIQAILQKPKQK